MPDPMLAEAEGAFVKVGNGRGFVILHDRRRLVITAAHCLPYFPPAHAASHLEERTYAKLLGALNDPEPTVWAECLFADPVADIAVLGEPDGQELYEENEAYEALTEPRPVLRIGEIPRKAPAWMLRLDGRWMRCTVRHAGGPLWIENTEEAVSSGMSGSPILSGTGMAVGAISTGSGPNPRLLRDLPIWLGSDEQYLTELRQIKKSGEENLRAGRARIQQMEEGTLRERPPKGTA